MGKIVLSPKNQSGGTLSRMSSQLNPLMRSDSPTHPAIESTFEYTKRKIHDIFRSLNKDSALYSPEKTIDSIRDYKNAGERILYSELSNYVYQIPPEMAGTFTTNLESLMKYALDSKNEITKDIQDTVIRLWDHCNLALHQIDNSKCILERGVSQTKNSLYDELYKEFKGIEKEYIAILGIFASIVIAFVAGITFSTSVLQNLHTSSVYRIVLVTLLIGLVLVNALYGLFYYVNKIVSRNSGPPSTNSQKKWYQKIKRPGFVFWVNAALLLLMGLTILGWYFGVVGKRNARILSPPTQEVTNPVSSERKTPPVD